MEKSVILTFDYEVFLGKKTGALEKSVLKPTRKVLDILYKNNAKAIFFVDATWLLFLKEEFPENFQLVSNQLKEVIKIGSSVELHLHPQWLNAIRKGDEIEFTSFKNYKLHSLSQEEILDLFRKTINLIESITLQRVQCFRAGGFCIEPFTSIKSAFEIHKIKYDFSVVPGMSQSGSNVNNYDFNAAPSNLNYRFQNNVNIPDPNGMFIEIPLSTYQNNPFYRLFNKFKLIQKKDRVFGDGMGIQEESDSFLRSLSRRIRFSKAFLTIDKTNSSFFKFLIKNHFKKAEQLVIISHPKTLSEEALLNLEYVTQQYSTLNSLDLGKLLIS